MSLSSTVPTPRRCIVSISSSPSFKFRGELIRVIAGIVRRFGFCRGLSLPVDVELGPLGPAIEGSRPFDRSIQGEYVLGGSLSTGAALANVNEVMAAKRHVLIECRRSLVPSPPSPVRFPVMADGLRCPTNIDYMSFIVYFVYHIGPQAGRSP